MKSFSKIYKLNKPLFHNILLESSGTDAEPKDIKRIQDMLNKAGSDISKLSGLATKMCNAITDKNKMLRRYNAALQICEPESVVIDIFKDGCKRLGVEIDNNVDAQNKESKTEVIDLNNPNTAEDEVVLFDADDIKDAAEEYNSQQTSEKDEINLDDPWTKLRMNPIKVLTAIQDKLSEYNIGLNLQYHQSNLNSTLNEWAKQSKRYSNKIRNIRISLARIVSLMTIDITLEYQDKAKSDTTYIKYKLSDVYFNIIKNYWNIDNAVIKELGSYTWYSGHGMNYHSTQEAVIALMPLLKSIGLVITKYIQGQKDFYEYAQKANEFYDKILCTNSNKTNVLYISHRNQNNSMMCKVKDKLIDMICEKFDVDNFPSTNWPGFGITSITQNKVTFNMHRASRNGLNKRDNITGQTLTEKRKIFQKFFKNILRVKPKDMEIAENGEITVELQYLINVLK